MPTVSAVAHLPVAPARAGAAWLEVDRWQGWVDGLEQVVSVDPDWPAVGARVVWQSIPAGRGRVTERLLGADPVSLIETEIDDPHLTGRQTLQMSPRSEGTQAVLILTYRLRRRHPLSWAIDLLFIRRGFTAALDRTLQRFAAACAVPDRPAAD